MKGLLVLVLFASACIQTAAPPSPPQATPVAVEQSTPAAKRELGQACTDAAECASGMCEGQGCGPDQGLCVDPNRMCTQDLVQYCGCDGQTFSGSGSCPGRRYEKRGACGEASAGPVTVPDGAAKKPAGSACAEAGECTSGVCEGQGCGETLGTCAPERRACTKDLREYCGCDGQVFRSSGSCPGRRYSKRGAC